MGRPHPLSKSVWAQLGRGTRGRDAEDSGAPTRVSEDAQATNVNPNAAALFEFDQQNRDQLPERPSTSAGPASSLAKRRNAEKRETKDDLYFNPLAAHGVGTTFYNFPLPGSRGSLPTPASSPKDLHHPATRKPHVTRPSTPESIEIAPGNMNVPQGEIGMALGSPQHPPTAWQQIPMERYTESPDHIDDEMTNSAPARQKTSKWKLLGGLFGGKKHEAQPVAFYQLQPEASQQPVNHGFDFGEPAASEKPKSRGRGRSNSSARKSRKHKPEMSRSNTVPLRLDPERSGRQKQTGTPEITIDGGNVIYDGFHSTQKGAGLLDVDIPSVQMERFSIMFGAVIQKPHSQPSSLLARRQATLDKLKTVNEALASKERELEAKSKLLMPRRATSPGFKTQSPAFSLFPSTPRTRDASPSSRSRPSVTLQRSNTSPAALSPSRPTFAPGITNEEHANLVSADSPTVPIRQHPDMYRGPRALRKKEEPKAFAEPAPEPNRWSPDQSQLLLDSSSDNENEKEDEIPLAVTVPMKPKLPEPTWQMVNPAHATNDSVSGSSTSGSDRSTSTSASSITTPLSASTAPYPVIKSLRVNSPPQTRTGASNIAQKPAMARSRSATTVAAPSSIPRRNASAAVQVSSSKSEDEVRLETAADVSIARQISVSRQQRHLLVPIKTSLKTSSTGTSSKKYLNSSNPSGSPMNDRVVGGQNFPAPVSGIGAIGKVSSPLGAIATATKEEHERGRGSPQVERIVRGEAPAERLVQVAKPSTPTLVVVGDGVGGKEMAWTGATANLNKPLSHPPVGFSERRRQKEATSSYSHTSPIVGEIHVGLAVSRDSSPTRHARDLSHRKSERVVFERVSVASN
ncbi:hypothetical protein ONS95_001707 [Cadophora gregata]|uniref:uncharacterized protein n=1 Tax=Cadophora gregata TaxID=51156 RepID=UPI0026DDC7EB|nr:uncharacterized protein ONS95_001707 [Cadophora gregata]KAK0111343.1 hypothetical protein ONS95_001707 [Cadophora gregata]